MPFAVIQELLVTTTYIYSVSQAHQGVTRSCFIHAELSRRVQAQDSDGSLDCSPDAKIGNVVPS